MQFEKGNRQVLKFNGLLYYSPRYIIYLSEIKWDFYSMISWCLEALESLYFVRIVHFYKKVLTTIPTCLGMEESMHHEGRNSWAKVT